MSAQFDEVLTLALQLSPAERIAIIERLAASFQMAPIPDETGEPFSDQELAELLHVDPLSPAEIAAAGLLGTWADRDISDGAAWVNEQKRQRRERRLW